LEDELREEKENKQRFAWAKRNGLEKLRGGFHDRRRIHGGVLGESRKVGKSIDYLGPNRTKVINKKTKGKFPWKQK